jgi:AraC family transcriptional regulator
VTSAPSDASRREYQARIHRVMDYIETHLGETLTLGQLAGVACFSAFHFHRIFTAMSGETLYRFILRLRLERAANQLLWDREKSVTAIALDCGFGSSAAFAHAFRAAFGASASEWREQDGKIRQAVGKDRQDVAPPGAYDGDRSPAMTAERNPSWRDTMSKPPQHTLPVKEADSVRIESLEATTVAYVRHVGPYAGNPDLFGRLFGRLFQWAGPRGLVGAQPNLLTIYHDNPEITEEDKLRISACLAVPDGTRADGDVGVMAIQVGEYAVATFTLDPSEYGLAWNWLMGVWFPSSGYQPDDRYCFERYLNDPKQHPEGKHVVELWEPVKAL